MLLASPQEAAARFPRDDSLHSLIGYQIYRTATGERENSA